MCESTRWLFDVKLSPLKDLKRALSPRNIEIWRFMVLVYGYEFDCYGLGTLIRMCYYYSCCTSVSATIWRLLEYMKKHISCSGSFLLSCLLYRLKATISYSYLCVEMEQKNHQVSQIHIEADCRRKLYCIQRNTGFQAIVMERLVYVHFHSILIFIMVP